MSTEDIKKEKVNRKYSKRRKKNRSNIFSNIFYYLFVTVLVLALAYTLSRTVFFNISEINVLGDDLSAFSKEDIINNSGVNYNDNLIGIDTKKVEKALVENISNIESAKVTKKYPNTLNITITMAKDAYNVSFDGGFLSVSGGGKILNVVQIPTDGDVTFDGLDPVSTEIGQMVQPKDEDKLEAFRAITSVLAKGVDVPVDEVNMENKFDITIRFEKRIIFDAGSWYDMDYKMDLAESAIKELDGNATGYLTMIGSNQVSFRTREAVNESRLQAKNAKENGTETTEETTENTNGQ